MSNKKNKFPKLKKSLKNFLTDESGKITKKDALGISAGAALLSVIDDVAAWHTSGARHLSQWHASWYNAWSRYNATRTAHWSGVVNGHYSWSPSGGHVNGTRIGSHLSQWHANGSSHGSHGSHGNHWSWGWC